MKFYVGVGLKTNNNYRGLSEMEARKYRVIMEVIEKRLKKKHAAKELNLSTKQTQLSNMTIKI